eukprot:UN26440
MMMDKEEIMKIMQKNLSLRDLKHMKFDIIQTIIPNKWKDLILVECKKKGKEYFPTRKVEMRITNLEDNHDSDGPDGIYFNFELDFQIDDFKGSFLQEWPIQDDNYDRHDQQTMDAPAKLTWSIEKAKG